MFFSYRQLKIGQYILAGEQASLRGRNVISPSSGAHSDSQFERYMGCNLARTNCGREEMVNWTLSQHSWKSIRVYRKAPTDISDYRRVMFSLFFSATSVHSKMTLASRLSWPRVITKMQQIIMDVWLLFCKQSVPLLSEFYRIMRLSFSSSKSRKDLNLKTEQAQAQVLFNLSTCFQSNRTSTIALRW